jgi:hypothetical protein
MDLREIGWDGVDCIGLAQDRDKWRGLVNSVMNVQIPGSAGKISSSFTTVASPVVLNSIELVT